MTMASKSQTPLAVGEAEAAPGAALAAAGDRRRGARTSRGRGTRPLHAPRSTPPAQSRRATRLTASPASTPRKLATVLRCRPRPCCVQPAGCASPPIEALGEGAAAGEAAGTAVGAGQQVDRAVDARILPHLELAVRERDQDAEREARRRRGPATAARMSDGFTRAPLSEVRSRSACVSSQAASLSTGSAGAAPLLVGQRAPRVATASASRCRRPSSSCHALEPPSGAGRSLRRAAHRSSGTRPALARRVRDRGRSVAASPARASAAMPQPRQAPKAVEVAPRSRTCRTKTPGVTRRASGAGGASPRDDEHDLQRRRRGTSARPAARRSLAVDVRRRAAARCCARRRSSARRGRPASQAARARPRRSVRSRARSTTRAAPKARPISARRRATACAQARAGLDAHAEEAVLRRRELRAAPRTPAGRGPSWRGSTATSVARERGPRSGSASMRPAANAPRSAPLVAHLGPASSRRASRQRAHLLDRSRPAPERKRVERRDGAACEDRVSSDGMAVELRFEDARSSLRRCAWAVDASRRSAGCSGSR